MRINYKDLIGRNHWNNIETLDELEMLKEDLEEYERVAFDTETMPTVDGQTGLDATAEVFGVVLAVGHKKVERVYWINFMDAEQDVCDEMIEIVRKLFTSGKWTLIFHNAYFDVSKVQYTWGIKLEHDKVNDTMLMAGVLRLWYKIKLSVLSKLVLDADSPWDVVVEQFFKEHKIKDGDRDYSDLPTQLVAGYACEDAEHTFNLFFALLPFFAKEQESLQTIYKLERSIIPAMSRMISEGMCIDIDYFKSMQTECLIKNSEQHQKFVELWEEDIKKIWPKKKKDAAYHLNLGSGDQMGQILFGDDIENGFHLPIELATRTEKTKKISCTGEVMDSLVKQFPQLHELELYRFRDNPILKTIKPILEKAIEKDGQYYINTSYFPIKASGRFSSGNVNLQNIMNDKKVLKDWMRNFSIRKGFIAPPGYLYVAMDFASFEVAILANASQDPDLIKDLLNGEDFHSRVASIAFHRPYEELRNKVDKEAVYQRTISKNIAFLFIYGGGINKACTTYGLTYEEAESVKYAIEIAYPHMVSWKKQIGSIAGMAGKTYTLCGRKNKVDYDKSYRAVNMICQGTAADIMKYGHRDIEQILKDRKTKQVATIHDEIHFYWHPDDVDLVADIVAALETPRFEIEKGTYVPMRMEPMVGDNWSEFRDSSVKEIEDLLRST